MPSLPNETKRNFLRIRNLKYKNREKKFKFEIKFPTCFLSYEIFRFRSQISKFEKFKIFGF